MKNILICNPITKDWCEANHKNSVVVSDSSIWEGYIYKIKFTCSAGEIAIEEFYVLEIKQKPEEQLR